MAESNAASENLDSSNQTIEELEKTHNEVQGTDDVDKLKELNKRLFERTKKAEGTVKELKAKPEIKTEVKTEVETKSSNQESTEDRVLELVGKVPVELKDEMSNIAKYMREHNMGVEDTINLFKIKKGLTVSKDEVEKYHKANEEANNSRTGGNANSSARTDSPVGKMSDADLDAAVQQAQARGEV